MVVINFYGSYFFRFNINIDSVEVGERNHSNLLHARKLFANLIRQ